MPALVAMRTAELATAVEGLDAALMSSRTSCPEDRCATHSCRVRAWANSGKGA